jgi:copper(I)-binding protein
MKALRWILAILVLFPIFLAGCAASDPSIQIDGAWARPAQAGANSAVYFVLSNRDQDDRLIGVRSSAANMVQVHATLVDEAGTASMQHQETLDVPAGSMLTFRPGGLHVMLMGLTSDLVEGDILQVTLIFETYGELEIDVPVENN